MWEIILLLVEMQVELHFSILSQKKKLKNLIQDKFSLQLWRNPMTLLLNSQQQEITVEMFIYSTQVNCLIILGKKDKLASLKTHYKMIRSLSFTEDSTKLLSSSDDYSIKLIDINSETVTNTF